MLNGKTHRQMTGRPSKAICGRDAIGLVSVSPLTFYNMSKVHDDYREMLCEQCVTIAHRRNVLIPKR